MKNFHDQKIVFFDKFEEHVYYPLGATKRTMTPEGQVFIEGKPEVKFWRHQYETKDPELAAAMVNHGIFFETQRHYYVAAECLPDALAKIYPTLHRENRRAVVLALIKGASVEDAKKQINKALEPKPGDDTAIPASAAPRCPFCSRSFSGSKSIEATLLLHVQTQHQPEVRKNPEWRKLIA